VLNTGNQPFDLRRFDDVTYIALGCPPYYKSRLRSPLPYFLIIDVDNNKNKVSIKNLTVRTIPVPDEEMAKREDRGMFKFLTGKVTPSWKKAHFLTEPERVAILQPAHIVKSLNIKPDMTILDIGAGIGLFTFPFAEALKGTGKVFATDVDPEIIKYMKRKVERGGYKNIFPVLVKHEGLAPFYKQHSFDIIFLCELYQYLWHPKDYFRELRPSLKKTGRLYILHFKNAPDFTEIEFDDFKRVIKILISNGEDFPILRRLSKEVQYFIKNWQDSDEVPFEIRTKIIQNFNKMLSDRLLFNDLLVYYTPEESAEWEWGRGLKTTLYLRDLRLADWLILRLDEDGVFDKKRKKLTDIDKKRLRTLNRIMLSGIFESRRLFDFLIGLHPIYAEKDSIISTLKKAGYQFVREYDFIPCYHFLEFKKRF